MSALNTRIHDKVNFIDLHVWSRQNYYGLIMFNVSLLVSRGLNRISENGNLPVTLMLFNNYLELLLCVYPYVTKWTLIL